MKTIWAMVGLVAVLWMGCEPQQQQQDPAATKIILGEKDEIVASEKPILHWVRQSDGERLQHTVFKGIESKYAKQFVQATEVKPLAKERYAVTGGKKLVLMSEAERYETWPHRGFLIWSNMDGILIAQLLEDDCPPVTIEVSATGIKRGGKSLGTASYMECEKTEQDEDGNWLVTKRVGSLAVPSDTGTVVVILDNFRLKNAPCCGISFADCCADLGAAGRVGATPSATSGYQILHAFNASTVCVEERCQSLIVHDCVTGKTYCFDALQSELRLEVWESGWFTVSVPDANANLPVLTECAN